MNTSFFKFKDPIIKLVESGLEIWARSQCEKVEEVEIELKGSSLSLLKGKLLGVNLTAKNAKFNKIPMKSIVLESGPIEFNISPIAKENKFAISDNFKVSGIISINERDLNNFLLISPWNSLGDWLSEKLMGITPLGGIEIEQEKLKLLAPIIGQEDLATKIFLISAEEGSILISSDDNNLNLNVPMDSNIQIDTAFLKNGQLHLQGSAVIIVR